MNAAPSGERFEHRVAAREDRKLRARREGRRAAWFGLGLFGLVGWSVALPTVLGVAIGLWIDRTWVTGRSWTLMLMVLGLVVGCVNAWNWIVREVREDDPPAPHEEQDESR